MGDGTVGSADFDLEDITIDGDLRIDAGENLTLTFTNVTVTGSVFNDSASNTLQINAVNSSLTAGDPGTGNGQTNIQNSVNVTITCVDTSGAAIENARVYIEEDPGGTEVINSLTNASGVATTSYNFSSDQAVIGRARRGTSSPLYKSSSISGTITSSGLTATVTMVDDE